MSGVLGPNDPTEQDIFDEVYRLMMLGVMSEQDADEEAAEKGFSSRFAEEENDAVAYLLKQHPHVVLDAYVQLMRRYVALEVEHGRLRRQIDAQEDDG